MRLLLAGCLALLVAAASAAPAQEAAQPRPPLRFFDPEDGYLDLSPLLARGGFIPVPIIITEPAVDGGFGFAAQFIRNPPPGSTSPPTRTIVGAVKTGNGSHGVGFMRSGSFHNGDLLYRIAAGTGTINLDFYPGDGKTPIEYGNESTAAFATARYKLGDSGFSVGPRYLWRTSSLSVDLDGRFPELESLLTRDVDLSGLGLELHFDDRDNVLSPRRGMNVVARAQRFDDLWGSDVSFNTGTLYGAWFRSRGDDTLGISGLIDTASSEAPIFMTPGIDIRSVPYGRYQGSFTFSSEVEVRRQFVPRWAGVAFAGYGAAHSSDSPLFASDVSAVGGGIGFRYRLARQFGLDAGLDLAFGPEGPVFYIQFGHAWGRNMD